MNCSGCGKRLKRYEQDNGLCDECDCEGLDDCTCGKRNVPALAAWNPANPPIDPECPIHRDTIEEVSV